MAGEGYACTRPALYSARRLHGRFHGEAYDRAAMKPARAKPIPSDDTLTFVPVGTGTGYPLPGTAEKLAAFYAKHPESRRTLRPGEKSPAELVQEARDERAEQIAPSLRDRLTAKCKPSKKHGAAAAVRALRDCGR